MGNFRFQLTMLLGATSLVGFCQSTPNPSAVAFTQRLPLPASDPATVIFPNTLQASVAGPVVVVLPIETDYSGFAAGSPQNPFGPELARPATVMSVTDSAGAVWTQLVGPTIIHVQAESGTPDLQYQLFAATLPNGIPSSYQISVTFNFAGLPCCSGWWSMLADPDLFTQTSGIDGFAFAIGQGVSPTGPSLTTTNLEVIAVATVTFGPNGYQSYPVGANPVVYEEWNGSTDAGQGENAFVYSNSNGLISPAGTYTPQFTYRADDFTSTPIAVLALHPSAVPPPSMVDPVPSLMAGPSVSSEPNVLMEAARAVQGVAADGVAETVIRIPTQSPGEQVVVTLENDQNVQSNSPDDDGALAQIGNNSFNQSQVSATSVNVSQGDLQGAFAFALYRAPVDFVRQANIDSDSALASRSVSLNIQNTTRGTNTSLPIHILRSPLVLVHGRGDSWHGWDNFSPLVSGLASTNSLFSIRRIDYSRVIGGQIFSTDPPLPKIYRIKASEMGLLYNVTNVQKQINDWINSVKQGKNPLGIPIAAVQADAVAHSMGGLMVRDVALQDDFLSSATFGQGNIHKLITIDTPHLGSQLAQDILNQNTAIAETGCLQNILANGNSYALNMVTFQDGSQYTGATADLVGDDTNGLLSPAIYALGQSSAHPLPFAPISGIYTNWDSLDSSIAPLFIRKFCSSDPLANSFTSSGWQALFHNNPNDAVVSLNSQQNGLDDPDDQFSNAMHSPSTSKLGFSPPSVLDGGAVGNQVLLLLNRSWKNTSYYYTITP